MSTFFFAQKAFIVKEEKILLVKKSDDDPYHPNKWEVPGGRMEFGETVNEHIKREVKEEVGLEIEVGEPFDIWTWQLKKRNGNGEINEIQIVAVARLCHAKTMDVDDSMRVEGDYLADIEWVKLDEVMSYPLIPDIIPIMKKFMQNYKYYREE